MNRATKREVVAALLQRGRRDLATRVVASQFATIVLSKPIRAMRAAVTPVLKKHRVWYRYSKGTGLGEDPHISVEFRDQQQMDEVSRDLAAALKDWPLGLEMYED